MKRRRQKRGGVLAALRVPPAQARSPGPFRLWPASRTDRVAAGLFAVLSAAGLAAELMASRLRDGGYVLVLLAPFSLAAIAMVLHDVWVNERRRVLSILTSVATVLLTLAAFHICRLTVAPDSPLVAGSVARPGDTLTLPPSDGGAGLLELRARMDARVKGAAVFALDIGGSSVEGTLIRTHGTVRIGRHREHVAAGESRGEWMVRLPAKANVVRVNRLAGPILGPVEVRIWRRSVPEHLPALLSLMGFALVGVVQGLTAMRLFAPAAACAFGPAAILAAWLPPDPAIERAVGALFLALTVSGFALLLVAPTVRRLARRR